MVLAGVKQILVTGTCFEYGLQNGCLSEEMPTVPVTQYGLSKDTLRKSLEMLQTVHLFTLQLITSNLLFSDWVNVFQNNLLTAALLDRITHKAVNWNMSGLSYRRREG